jgi:hypothetical protein
MARISTLALVATLTPMVDVSVFTIATTAGGPSLVTGATIGPQDILAGDIIQLLVGGANVGAAAAIEVDVRLQH